MGYDFFHLPPSQKSDVQVFSPTAYATNVQWQTWEKPRGVSFVHIVAVSGGCGGGAGAVGAVSTAAGGGGGASGQSVVMWVPAWMLPDRLYISVGHGGAGGVAGAGGLGGYTYIAVHPDSSVVQHLLVMCGVGTGGGAGSGATAGTAGAVASSIAVGSALLSGLGAPALASTNLSPAGQPGVAGGATGAGNALTLPTTGIFLTGGTGGGGLGNNASDRKSVV